MNYIVALLIAIGLTTSCTVQKKHYSKGYHVTFNHKVEKNNQLNSNATDKTNAIKTNDDLTTNLEQEYQESIAANSTTEDVVSVTKLNDVPVIIKRKVTTLITNNRIQKPSKQNESNLTTAKEKKASTKNDSYASKVLKLALIFALLLFIFMMILIFVVIFGAI